MFIKHTADWHCSQDDGVAEGGEVGIGSPYPWLSWKDRECPEELRSSWKLTLKEKEEKKKKMKKKKMKKKKKKKKRTKNKKKKTKKKWKMKREGEKTMLRHAPKQ